MEQHYGTGNNRRAAWPHDWRSILAAASTEEEVLEFVRGYLATWGTQDLASLPAECRPGRVKDAEDIDRWAFELASSHWAATFDKDDRPVLEHMLVFATQAAAHLSQVQATRTDTLQG